MPFESLSFRIALPLEGLPDRWLPLIHLYDADLPLFPIYYFHSTSATLPTGNRPTETDRVFGYVERLNIGTNGDVHAVVVTNKDLDREANSAFREAALSNVRDRIGLNDPVTIEDVRDAFTGDEMQQANLVLAEIWERVVARSYGNKLPFGRLWDEVLGLARFVASFRSQAGRKGELIQTHYFARAFGHAIQTGGGIPPTDFYLLPTIGELADGANPLTAFPRFARLISVAATFQERYCDTVAFDGLNLSRFRNPRGGTLNTEKLLSLFDEFGFRDRPIALECYNAFGKGTQRPVLFFLMLADLRAGRLQPASLSSLQCGSIYDSLGSTYQSPKVIEIYAQQSFGNEHAMPIDTWVETFLKWPLKVCPDRLRRGWKTTLFSSAQNLGKVERLIWVTAQARKVHSSACNDAVWCIKKASAGSARGANPLACGVCAGAIRSVCPAYLSIHDKRVVFNTTDRNAHFVIKTTDHDNTHRSQGFVECTGFSIYDQIADDFTPADVPQGFAPYPHGNHNGESMSVEEFIERYGR